VIAAAVHLASPPIHRRPTTERPHSRRAILAGAVVIVLVVVALRR
jgi:hypothetical protein